MAATKEGVIIPDTTFYYQWWLSQLAIDMWELISATGYRENA